MHRDVRVEPWRVTWFLNDRRRVRIPNDFYLIVDVEATCSNDGAVPRHEMEIIEIGAVMLNARTFEIESEFQSSVRPVRHPELTEFCTSLTGISQNDVEGGPSYAEAIRAMRQWMAAFENSLFCSWGDYDRGQFIQDCQHHQIDYPFAASHMNLKAEFSRVLGLKKKLGVGKALQQVGLDFEGSPHRGLDDAKNIARIVRAVLVDR